MTGKFSIGGWRDAHAETPAGDFEILHPYLFLVSAPVLGDRTPRPQEDAFQFKTRMDAEPSAHGLAGTAAAEDTLILPVRKSQGNPFQDRISIGRANNCDIVVRDPSVSKLHGHFREVEAVSAIYMDDGSSNGTVVGHERVPAGKPVPVTESQRIVVGRVCFRLLSARGVHELIQGH